MTDSDARSTRPPTTWAAGDYPALAARLMPVAARAVAAAEVEPGMCVLDVGCGTGNAALLAAQAGARTIGVDATPELLAIAAARAREAGVAVAWRLGDAADLDLADGTADRVLSVFGAIYAPDQPRVAAELARVCRTGGRVVSTAWTPDGFIAAAHQAIAPYLPPPPAGASPPDLWGDPDPLAGLPAPHGLETETRIETLQLEFPSLREAAEFWVRVAGHVQIERPRLEAEGRWPRLLDDPQAVFAAWNDGSTAPVAVNADYLLAVAVKTRG